ncbi:nitrous oxide-stimulated promoter family protein, partial [Salmonella enterica subsp. enterica serovar Anatum]|nr:nitrous oxide-stimulated promoter family protein [Salmonella enterica subsp. enterica serovar Anatum]
EKPACKQCPVHCYQPAKREEMKQIMRWAGPRMLWRHPVLTVRAGVATVLAWSFRCLLRPS